MEWDNGITIPYVPTKDELKEIYKGTWKDSNKRKYLRDPIFRRNRNRILKRMKHRCFSCSKYSNSVHHMDLTTTNHEESNLISLCPSCHTKLHAKIRTTNT